jgi:hypothetical protein
MSEDLNFFKSNPSLEKNEGTSGKNERKDETTLENLEETSPTLEQRPESEMPDGVAGSKEKNLQIKGGNVWARYRGILYNLGSENPKEAFVGYYGRIPFFPFPEDLEEVIAYLVKQGDLNLEQAQQIREKYKIADLQRRTPYIEYYPTTGEISLVIIDDGYDLDYTQYWLSPLGYCRRYDFVTREGYLLPSSTVLSILESRRDTMDPEEFDKLIKTFTSAQQKIDLTYEYNRIEDPRLVYDDP